MGQSVVGSEHDQARFVSKRSPDYRLEFINGAFSNITPRGEIVCEFHFESKDMPTEQSATILGDGLAELSLLPKNLDFTKEVKFGIIINVAFAKDLLRMLNEKIKQGEEIIASREKEGAADESNS